MFSIRYQWQTNGFGWFCIVDGITMQISERELDGSHGMRTVHYGYLGGRYVVCQDTMAEAMKDLVRVYENKRLWPSGIELLVSLAK